MKKYEENHDSGDAEQVQEAALAYGYHIADFALKEFVNNKLINVFHSVDMSYDTFFGNKFLITKAVKEGVSFDLWIEIKNKANFDDQRWSSILDINLRTLQRYNKDESHVFSKSHSEKIFEIAEVVVLGNSVFGDDQNFRSWLSLPSLALGGEKPIELLDTSYGKDLVLAELTRLEYGVFA